MKLLKILILILSATVIFNCTKKEAPKTYRQFMKDSIRVTMNSAPADTSFRVRLKEVGFIDMENDIDTNRFVSEFGNLDIDENGNIFFMDSKSAKIFKFDKDYKFVKTIGRKGKGPGEFNFPGTISIREDTIYIPDWSSMQIIKYDTEGNYLGSKKKEDFNSFPSYPKKFGERYIQSSSKSMYDKDKGMVVTYDVSIFEKNFELYKELFKDEFTGDWEAENDPTENGYSVIPNDSVLFIYKKSKTDYYIEKYNIDGIKTAEIRKNHRRIKAGPKLTEFWDEKNKEFDSKFKVNFVNSIIDLKTDKYGRLWANVYNDDLEGLVYDIFENDIFINRITLDLNEGASIKFVGDKLIAVNKENNNVKIFEY